MRGYGGLCGSFFLGTKKLRDMTYFSNEQKLIHDIHHIHMAYASTFFTDQRVVP